VNKLIIFCKKPTFAEGHVFMWLGTHVGSQPPFLVARESFWVLWRFLDHRMVPCGVPWVLHGSSGSWVVPQVPGWFLGAMGGLPLLSEGIWGV